MELISEWSAFFPTNNFLILLGVCNFQCLGGYLLNPIIHAQKVLLGPILSINEVQMEGPRETIKIA